MSWKRSIEWEITDIKLSTGYKRHDNILKPAISTRLDAIEAKLTAMAEFFEFEFKDGVHIEPLNHKIINKPEYGLNVSSKLQGVGR